MIPRRYEKDDILLWSGSCQFGPMGRQLACPISVQPSSDNNGKETTQASSCIIDQ
jgi:hypothetical protein